MSLKEYGKGGGQYISAADLENGQRAKLLGAPRVEYDESLGKDVVRAPMEIEGVNGDTWSPGKNAVQLLLTTLGQDETTWPYPIEGTMEQRKVQTKSGQRDAWHFVPNGTKIAPKAPTPKKSPGKGASSTSSFKCGMCPKTFPTSDKLKEHINGEH